MSSGTSSVTLPEQRESFNLRRFLLSGGGWPYVLVPLIPLSKGESTWFEGLLLLALYTMMGVTFFLA